MLKENQSAPNFELPDAIGKTHTLSEFKGKKIILYFYPRDDTPGCTKEACDFRDNYSKLKNKNSVVIGISLDTNESHTKFIKKYDLPFILLSDPEKKTIKKYDAWQKKSMYGKTYMGIQRSTFIIDEKGKIIKIFPKVSVDGHVNEILEFI